MLLELNPLKWGKNPAVVWQGYPPIPKPLPPAPAPPAVVLQPLPSQTDYYEAVASSESYLRELAAFKLKNAESPITLSSKFPISSTPAKAEESTMSNKFIGFLETVGKDFKKGLTWAVTEAPAVGSLVSILFPALKPEVAEATTAITLIQNAVILVEQKYAASGVQDGTGEQKAAELVSLAGPAVISLLAKAGIAVDSAYLQSLIDAVVGVLNATTPVATPAAA